MVSFCGGSEGDRGLIDRWEPVTDNGDPMHAEQPRLGEGVACSSRNHPGLQGAEVAKW